nr:hypothetical protein [Actinomycetota bacterium]
GETGVRRASSGDEAALRDLLDLDGMPRWLAAEERFLVLERGGDLLAALEYRVCGGCLVLGPVVADPWAGERWVARVLYAEAHALAKEMGLRGVEASNAVSGDYPYEVGYLKGSSGWRLGAYDALKLRGELPEGGWRRALALLGLGAQAVPFFRSFPR